MGWDEDVERLVPDGDKKEHVRDYMTFGCLPVFLGSERDAYAYYTGSKYFWCTPRHVALVVCSMPTFALISCILIALLFYFEEATNTHCHVWNVLPSISTVIGGFYWTNMIWSFFVYLHILPRFIIASAYFQWFRRVVSTQFIPITLCFFTAFLNFLELLALLSLTYYNSNYNHHYHVISFTVFGTTALVHMLLHCLQYYSTDRQNISKHHLYSWRFKKRAFATSVGTLLTCTYLFYRHNKHCEPYVFSIFSFFEYIFVLSNIAFHSTFQYDFHGKVLYVS